MILKQEPEFIARYRESDMKPQCLWEHLQGVTRQAGKFGGKVGLKRTGQLVGLTHDLGKATLEFQKYLKSAVGVIENQAYCDGRKLDHATAGAQILYEAFLRSNDVTTLTSDILALVVASHHGLVDALTPDGRDYLGDRLSKDESETRKEQALATLPANLQNQLQALINGDVDKEIEEFLRKALDPVDSWTEKTFKAGLLVRFLMSCLIDADRLDAANFDSRGNAEIKGAVDWSFFIESLERYLGQFKADSSINLLRRDISEKCRVMAGQEQGFFRLSVPTGGGKTMASLRFALHHAQRHDLERIVYVIPYTSIIDQNAKSIRQALGVDMEDFDTVLEHHSNLNVNENDEEKTEFDYTRYKMLAENWDAPIILTTMVQFLETLFGTGTNNCRRMHRLANSVIIFDEIQTLSVNMVHLFNLAVKFLVQGCGATVMLCTATQPLLHQLKTPARSIPFDFEKEITVSKEQKIQSLRRVSIFDRTRPLGWSASDIAELALDESGAKKSVLVIVNTKRDASNIFKVLENKAEIPVYHLSTSMYPVHRIEELGKIIEILDESQPLILVSTQLIEAGVDVDFDVVIRSLAGIDSIAQATGRCNRHGIKPYGGRVILVNSSEEGLSRLPDIAIAKKNTERILEEFRNDKQGLFEEHLLSDAVLNRYFEYYYHARSNLMNYPVDAKSPVGRSDNLVDLLGANERSARAYQIANQNQQPNRFLRQSFKTATRSFEVIPDSGRGVIIPDGDGVELIAELSGTFEPNKQFKILRKAQRFSVNCFSNELERLAQADALYEAQEGSGILCLREGHYHARLGLTIGKSSEMSVLHVD